ncbi:hypothetical protein ABW19_dt0203691 [Dactylella cylindrospora]|nr:hypothetical protein ABW19_dt0203691 [Dactylella cylindrospora]
MNILNTHLLSSVSGSTGSGIGGSNVGLLANIFLTSLLVSLFTPETHELLISAVSWCTVAVICWLIRKQAIQNGDLQPVVDKKTRRKATVLVGCILLSGICDRVVGTAWRGKAAWWNKAGLPLVTTFLRNHLLGEPGILEGAARGSKRLFSMVSIIAFLALMPIFISDTSMALGLSSIVFQSMIYVMLEDFATGSIKDTKNTPGATVDLKALATSGYPNAAIGATVGLVLSTAYFEKPLHDYALHQNPGYALARVLVIGALGGLRWLCLPLLVCKMSSPSGSLLDLSVTLVASQLSFWTSPFQLLGTIASLILIALHFSGAPGNREVVPQILRPTRAIVAAGIIVIIILPLFMVGVRRTVSVPNVNTPPPPPESPPPHIHPIKFLMEQRASEFEVMKHRQSTSLRDAVRNYKKRYGMPPPPNFDKWYEFAVSRKSALIDEYDTIYHQIQPFWGLPPKVIRERAREALGFKQAFMRVSVRNGKVIDALDGADWQRDATVGMINQFREWIPDMDLAFNTHDEPRIVVPSADMDAYVKRAKGTQYAASLKNTFTGFPKDEAGKVLDIADTRFNEFAHQGIWGSSRLSCPEGTPAQDPFEEKQDAVNQFASSPIGFIWNRTASMDVCLQPSLQQRHGFFQRPNAFHVSHYLFPIFSQSKVSCYNDIIYPSPWYWAGKVSYDGAKDVSWDEKKELIYWRGSTTGGFSRLSGWKRQHRQRVVTYLNAFDETCKIFESSGKDKDTVWKVKNVKRKELQSLIDVKFSHIGQCDDVDCEEQKEFFKPTDMVDQQDAWMYKYLLDMDGNAFSGRFYAFLESNSAVFKMALFKEWHEEWLMPWVHYIPLSLDMGESMETLRYFTKERDGVDAIKRIAEQGRYWAGKVLRKEDFEVWFFRLLLEYGRVIDDNRENIGFDI